MSVNTMNFEQSATLLTSLYKQATGETALTPTSEAEFVSLAQTTLRTNYDYMATAISQVLTRTIFAVRGYSGKLKGLAWDAPRYGGIVRKLTPLDIDIEDDERYSLTDGQSVDMYKVNKPKSIQTNFYGETVHQLTYTIYKDQLDNAFESSAQFGSFMAMVIRNIMNQLEQIEEAERRLALTNMIGAKIDADTDNCIHLITEYKNDTGNTTITKANYKSEEEFPFFAKWLYGRLETLIKFMSNRSSKYHMNISTYNGVSVKPIMRFTDKEYMKIYLLTSLMKHINSSVLSSVFHKDLLTIPDYEEIDFWQSIESPENISVTPVIMDDTGAYATGDAVETSDVVGVIFDEDCTGVGRIKEWSATTPLNTVGGYWNTTMHFTTKPVLDLTENCVVLMMD